MSVETVFKKVMNETACDMAEVLFTTEREKKVFINNAWDDYGDDIEEHIDGELDDEKYNDKTFEELSEKKQEKLVIQAIKDNAESIFDLTFNE